VLVTAGDLLDGGAIKQMRRDHVSYVHLALDSHDVILAEGLPCETLFELEAAMADGAHASLPGAPFAPRISQGKRLAAIREMISTRYVRRDLEVA
jgi:hypothetical protein